MRKAMRSNAAFTFVELMIVMTIIAILMAIAIPNFLEAQTRAAVARSKCDLALLKSSVDSYRVDHRAFPPNAVAGKDDGWALHVLTTPVVYLSHLPLDVFTIADGAHRVDVKTLNPLPYRYYNALQIDPVHGLNRLADDPPGSEGFFAGLLWGFGPGSVFSPGFKASTAIDAEGMMQRVTYDPSNGTITAGDIYQLFP